MLAYHLAYFLKNLTKQMYQATGQLSLLRLAVLPLLHVSHVRLLHAKVLTPPEVAKAAEEFINNNPQSLASIYILSRTFIQNQTPDYDKALDLATVIMKASPENHAVAKLKKQLEGLKNFKDKGQLPKFTVTDINGKTVSNVDLYAKVNVISTWASWNYDSQNAQRKLKRLERDYGSQLKFVSICLDADKPMNWASVWSANVIKTERFK